MNEPNQDSSGFGDEVDRFVTHVEALRAAITPLEISADLVYQWNKYRFNHFLVKHGDSLFSNVGQNTFRICPGAFRRFEMHLNRVNQAMIACDLLPRSLLVSLVSQFDAFLARTIRAMIRTKPGILDSSEKTVTYSKLMSFPTIEKAKEYVIEKEIESVLRKSHIEQFVWLENKLEMPLRKDLHSWGLFVEITERRNLLVHCEGIVSHQYVETCREYGSPLPDGITIGQELDVCPVYYKDACDCIAEIGIKLGHVIWRKLLPGNRESADGSLNETCLELLSKGNYRLAQIVLEFAVNVLKKHSSERDKLTFLVNLAQAYKWQGDNERCRKLLEHTDWSATADDLKIVIHALRGEYTELCAMMKRFGADGPVDADEYKDWPAFKECRERTDFCEAFQATFQQPLEKIKEALPLKEEHMRAFFEGILRDETEEV